MNHPIQPPAGRPMPRMTEEQIVEFLQRTAVLCTAIGELEEMMNDIGETLPEDIAETAAELEKLAEDELIARGIGKDLPPDDVHERN